MACKDFRMIATEDALEKAALVGIDATAEQRIAALAARALTRLAAVKLSPDEKLLLDALQEDDGRGLYIGIRQS
jgi:hypothetical protein